jgi:hypothetical protein
MRSRADALRVASERVLRVLTLVVLSFAAWSAARPGPDRGSETGGSAALGESLARWTVAPPRDVHVPLEAAPRSGERDWLRALRRAGTPVTWQGEAIPALALEAMPAVAPRGGITLSIAAPAGARVAVGDDIGVIDTVVAPAGGATLLAPLAAGPLTASIGAQRAVTTPQDTLPRRRLLVLGRVGWEAKFVISALEEAGWTVEARLGIAPGHDVEQGAPRPPDTARYGAVVVLDAPSPATSAAITRYVRAGGGAVLAGGAGTAQSLAALSAGRTGARVRPSTLAFADDAPRRALAFFAIIPRADAIVLDERESRVAAAARRVDAGRVIQLGYDETWRWRLAGGAQSPDAHRAWWSAVVASVAHRAAVPVSTGRNDEAPLARLVDALGAPAASLARSDRARFSLSPRLLFALVSLLLLAELASRRLRGAP